MRLIAQLYLPIVRLTQFQITAAATRISVERLYEIFDEPEPVSDRPGARPIVRPRGELVFDAVTFAYGRRKPTLDRLALTIPPGTTLGIIGPSGAGKSTMLALAPRLYDVADGCGSIRFDGADVRDLKLADLRRVVALVPQQALLFEGTIRSNLDLRRPRGHRRTRSAGRSRPPTSPGRSTRLPLGLDTIVGERGQSLSGGQRQRLALARALIADPAVLLIDDGTSALDAETEARVRSRSGRADPAGRR